MCRRSDSPWLSKGSTKFRSYIGLYWGYIGVIWDYMGLYGVYMGIMENKMETTI